MAILNCEWAGLPCQLEVFYRSQPNHAEIVFRLFGNDSDQEWVRRVFVAYPGDWTHYRIARRLQSLSPGDFQKIDSLWMAVGRASSFELQAMWIKEPVDEEPLRLHLLILPDPTDPIDQNDAQVLHCVRVAVSCSLRSLRQFGSDLLTEVKTVLAIP